MNSISDTKIEKNRKTEETIILRTVSAALATDGVVRLAGGITNTLSSYILRKELLSKGIRLTEGKDGKVIIDVFVIVGYGTNIPVTAWDLQTNIKKSIEKDSDIRIEKVNVHVQGVYIPEQED